jgi:hypothetical protein
MAPSNLEKIGMNRKQRTRNTIIAGVVGVMFVSALYAAGDRDKNPPPRDVTLTGKIVDLQSFMTGKFASSDKAKCTRDSIRGGVPAALETKDGLVVIGEGTKGAARTIAPLAFQDAELKGKLYEKHGVRYIDITSAKAAKPEPEPEPDTEEPLTPEPDEAANGACCLPNGTCVETDEDNCYDREGAFYAGSTCDDVDCK